MGLFRSVVSKLKGGVEKTRQVLVGGLRSMLRGRRIDDALIAELEQRLVQSDVGIATALRLVDGVRSAYKAGKITEGDEVLDHLRRDLIAMWPEESRGIRFAPAGQLTVIVVAGVNGVGKTTSVAKLAHSLKESGRKVMLAACDTYRAGAVRQLEIWADRLAIPLIKGQQGGDPAAVAFDACEAARARGADTLVLDTAGRMHTDESLMRQLGKIRDVVSRQVEGAPHEVLLVLDATTGQNAVRQAERFNEAIDVTGVFLSKLDGTARGGVVVAVHEAIGAPVKFIGVGETVEDVEPFDPVRFIDALFAED